MREKIFSENAILSDSSDYYEVCIIGGGPVGLAAALAMVQKGFSVALIEGGALNTTSTSTSSSNANRVYALNLASQTLLENLMVWKHIEPTSMSPYQNMDIWDVSNQGRLDFDSRMIVQKELGYIVEENGLKAALLKVLAGYPHVSLFTEQKITALLQEEKRMILKSKDRQWKTSLLMIADGAQSPCRQMLKVPVTEWSYHQTAIVASVEVEKAHQQTAYQVFHPKEVLAFLPLSNNKRCSIVWSTSPQRAQQLMATTDDVFNEILMKTFQTRLGQVKVVSQRAFFPLNMRHVQQYSDTAWLLLGDAAHTIHPFVGWGLNLGFSDLKAWLDCFDSVGADLRFNSRALAAYQRQRKNEIWKVIGLLEGLKTLFFNRLPPIATLRGWGLNACNSILPLKQVLIEYATKI